VRWPREIWVIGIVGGCKSVLIDSIGVGRGTKKAAFCFSVALGGFGGPCECGLRPL
jgi:hypothetical protein